MGIEAVRNDDTHLYFSAFIIECKYILIVNQKRDIYPYERT